MNKFEAKYIKQILNQNSELLHALLTIIQGKCSPEVYEVAREALHKTEQLTVKLDLNCESIIRANINFDRGFDDAVAGRPQKGSSKNYFAGYQKGFEMAEAVGLNKKRAK